MKKLQYLLQLFRIKHYIKNILIFVPLVFAYNLINKNTLIISTAGFLSFSFMASSIYILNDIFDSKNDKQHPTKKNRPIASGKVSVKEALIACFCFIVISFSITIYLIIQKKISCMAFIYLSLYLILNILYSIWLKNIPLIDIMILVSGFLIRLLYGAVIVNTYVSAWLYLTVMSGAFYLVLGKRRNEIKISTETNTRVVLKKYSFNFLDKFMYTCLTMTCVFYAIWSKEYHDKYMILTFPIVLLIFLQYSYIIEGDSDGDPVEVILKNETLIILCILYILVLFGILFF